MVHYTPGEDAVSGGALTGKQEPAIGRWGLEKVDFVAGITRRAYPWMSEELVPFVLQLLSGDDADASLDCGYTVGVRTY